MTVDILFNDRIFDRSANSLIHSVVPPAHGLQLLPFAAIGFYSHSFSLINDERTRLGTQVCGL
jgi:hypothetical protein